MAQGGVGGRRGFTLRELFWVCAVVAGAAGFLALASLPYKAPAESASCRSNLKQIGRALAMYAMDYNDRLPPYAYVERGQVCAVPHLLDPYLKNVGIWRCPSRKGGRAGDATLRAEAVAYGYNWLGLTRDEQGLPLEQVPKLRSTVAFVDTDGYLAVPRELVFSEAGFAPIYRHTAGKSNVLWLDGNVTSMGRELDEWVPEPFTAGVVLYRRWNIRWETGP